MTENEHKQAIKNALKRLREGIQRLQDDCSEEISNHMKALGFSWDDAGDFDVAEFIEKMTGIGVDSYFPDVFDSICEDIIFCGEP